MTKKKRAFFKQVNSVKLRFGEKESLVQKSQKALLRYHVKASNWTNSKPIGYRQWVERPPKLYASFGVHN